jgi:hypothetical protein
MYCPRNANEGGYTVQAEQKPLYDDKKYSCSELIVMH